MPLITNNSSLGDLFGGKIATMNFSYEPNSSPSSATITVVSENNRYIEPVLYSRIVLPILGIPMRIVEVQYNDDGDSKTLQVEMLDELSFILDKRLILINGVHSTGLLANEETKGSYPYIEYLGHPKANWREYGPTKERIKKTQYGVLLGSNRTTITINKSYSNFTPSITNPSISLVYDAQKRNVEAGTASEAIYNKFESDFPTAIEPEEFSHTNEWGYTLSDFSTALSSFGIRIYGLPTTNASAYFFNNTGTIRSVLSSILSTFGLSFYVDPHSMQIFVINNITIDTINRNLKLLYDANIQNLQNNEGATKGTFKKTLKSTTARRLVMDTSFVEPESKDVKSPPASPKRKTFHRIKFDRLKKGWDYYEFEFLKKCAGIYLTDIDRSIIDLYIYALSKSDDPHLWTSKPDDLKVYGGKFDDNSTMIDQTQVSLFNKDPQSNRNSIPFWQQAIMQGAQNFTNPSQILPGFDYRNLEGALPNTKTVKEDSGVIRSNLFAADPPDRLEEFAMAMNWIGFGDFHITSPMSKRRTERFGFIEQSPYKVIGPYPSLTKISEIPELGYINYLAIRSGKEEEELTVGDLFDMRRTKEEGGPIDEFGFTRNISTPTIKDKRKSFHFIAYLDLDLYKNIFDFDAGKLLKENFYLFNIADAASSANAEQWLLVTNKWADLIESVQNTCEDLYRYWYIGEGKIKVKDTDKYVRDTSDTRTFKYMVTEDEEGGGEDGGGEINIENKGIFTKNSKLPDNLFLNIEVDSLSLASLTSEEAAKQLSTEQVGPFYEINLNYYRPPNRSDFEILKGLKSISSSVGPEGITTDISYSSKLYQEINRSFLFKYSDKSINSGPTSNNNPSFVKNLRSR